MEHMHKESNESSCKNKGHILFFYKGLEINLLMWIISGHDLMGHYFGVSTLNHTWKHSFYGIPGHKQT
jgi:hypothetical protein